MQAVWMMTRVLCCLLHKSWKDLRVQFVRERWWWWRHSRIFSFFFLSPLLSDLPTHSLMLHANSSTIMIFLMLVLCSATKSLYSTLSYKRARGWTRSRWGIWAGRAQIVCAHRETRRPNHATAPGASSARRLCAARSERTENVKLTTKLSGCVASW